MSDPIQLLSATKAHRDLSHQIAAWRWLQQDLSANRPEALAQFAELFRADPPEKDPSPSPGRLSNPLPVPFFAQQDNGPEGWRQCQSSSIAMCLAYLKVPGIRDDLDYLAVVRRYGDTTVQEAHRQALKQLGVRARFRQDLTPTHLQAEIKAGYPVAIGILHHGPVSAPTGGGHYITVRGFDTTAGTWLVHDPYGELDLVRGGWADRSPTAGRNQSYSFRNLNPRFMPGGSGGWGWLFS